MITISKLTNTRYWILSSDKPYLPKSASAFRLKFPVSTQKRNTELIMIEIKAGCLDKLIAHNPTIIGFTRLYFSVFTIGHHQQNPMTSTHIASQFSGQEKKTDENCSFPAASNAELTFRKVMFSRLDNAKKLKSTQVSDVGSFC